jgi:DNA-binding XRE family transcriptional regulator
MTKNVWYHPDPEDPTFTIVSYQRPPKEERRYRRRRQAAAAKAVELELMLKDPMVKFEYEKYCHERQALRRYKRNPQFSNCSNAELLARIRSTYSAEYAPLIISKKEGSTGVREVNLPKSFKFNKRGPDAGQMRKLERNAAEGITNVRYFTRDFVSEVGKKRQELGLTQKDLALKLNLPESTLNTLERGELPFDGELKGKLSVELGI